MFLSPAGRVWEDGRYRRCWRLTRVRLTPAGLDHLQIAAFAAIADCVAALPAHRFGDAAEPRLMVERAIAALDAVL